MNQLRNIPDPPIDYNRDEAEWWYKGCSHLMKIGQLNELYLVYVKKFVTAITLYNYVLKELQESKDSEYKKVYESILEDTKKLILMAYEKLEMGAMEVIEFKIPYLIDEYGKD